MPRIIIELDRTIDPSDVSVMEEILDNMITDLARGLHHARLEDKSRRHVGAYEWED